MCGVGDINDVLVNSIMDACLYCLGYKTRDSSGVGGFIGCGCRVFFWPVAEVNVRMSRDLPIFLRRDTFLCACAGKRMKLGRNFLMSDALRLCCMVATCSACLINAVFVFIHCFIDALDFVSHSSMSIWNGCLSCTRSVSSCLYRAWILVKRASLVAVLVCLPLDGPCSASFRASHLVLWYAQVSRMVCRIHLGSPDTGFWCFSLR